MSAHAAIVIATTGRPALVPLLLAQIEAQTIHPEKVIFSAHEEKDIGVLPKCSLSIEVIYGPPGSSTQRNAALGRLNDDVDIVIFFDDDFVPSRFWVERALAIFERPEVVAVTGTVLFDGAQTPGKLWHEGLAMVTTRDQNFSVPFTSGAGSQSSLYGCNMAVRRTALKSQRFDERLVLYGWLEDRDLSFRLGQFGSVITSSDLWGVHLGIKRGRTKGVRLGYSQVVNPWYLFQKGTMSYADAIRSIIRPLIANALKSISPEEFIDRRGRLKGNLMGLYELLMYRKKCRPEYAVEL